MGEDWFKMQKSSSSALDYQIEVENVRLKKLPDGWYHKYNEARHQYVPERSVFGDMLICGLLINDRHIFRKYDSLYRHGCTCPTIRIVEQAPMVLII